VKSLSMMVVRLLQQSCLDHHGVIISSWLHFGWYSFSQAVGLFYNPLMCNCHDPDIVMPCHYIFYRRMPGRYNDKSVTQCHSYRNCSLVQIWLVVYFSLFLFSFLSKRSSLLRRDENGNLDHSGWWSVSSSC
jgi:hypothetical protein